MSENDTTTEKPNRPIVTEDDVRRAIFDTKKIGVCPIHGDEPPAINIGGLLMAKHDLDGRWCICCLLDVAKKNGAHRLNEVEIPNTSPEVVQVQGEPQNGGEPAVDGGAENR